MMCYLSAVFASLAGVGTDAGPLPPDVASKSFRLETGWVIELVAAEPLVVDPVALSFDELGRMFVVEYRDYPNGPSPGKPHLSRIKRLEDLDGDGRMDRAHVFADQLPFAQGIMAWKGGLLVTSWPYLEFHKDTDGDSRADRRDRLFQVASQKVNPQLRMAHPRLGLDNWVYITNGLGGTEITSATQPTNKVRIARHDFRFHSQTLEFEPATGFGQFGNTFDDWGNRFVCSNRNPVIHAVLPYRALVRNPYAMVAQGYEDVAPSGGDAKVYPIAETTTTAYSHQGSHTAACGVHVYRGGSLGSDSSVNVFVCEPTGYLITRSVLRPHGVSFRCERARPKEDFLASTDTWFRPVSLADGPDGCLYVVDMYRAVIEHPDYMVGWFPKEYIDRLNFRAGEDRGRIWRVRPTGAKPRPFTPPKTTADLVNLLSHPNGWRRDLGQRLLVEQHVTDAVGLLDRLLTQSPDPRTRVHALWTLSGLDALTMDRLHAALEDRDPRVRENAVHATGTRLREKSDLFERLEPLYRDESPRVRFAVALALIDVDNARATEWLAAIASRDVGDPWVRRAVLAASKNRAGTMIALLLMDSRFQRANRNDQIELLSSLAEVIGARGDEDELARLFHLVSDGESIVHWRDATLLIGVARGLARHTGKLGKTSLSKLLANPASKLRNAVDTVRRLFESAGKAATNGPTVEDRTAAIKLLAYSTIDCSLPVFAALLDLRQPQEIQAACIDAIAVANHDLATRLLIDRWSQLHASVLSAALDLLLQRSAMIRPALQAMADGVINPAIVPLEQRTRLLRSEDQTIQTLAQKAFGGAASSDRKAVIDQYRAGISAKGDANAGRKAFQKACAKCHRINGEGFQVGPDISDLRNKTKETLLFDILDPNGAVEPRWLEYVVATTDGRVLTGLLASESTTTIVLRRAEEKQELLSRAEIDSIRTTGKSIMPEGVEKELSVQELADLIEFLKRQQ